MWHLECRSNISADHAVIGKQRGSFKRVFEGAQEQLRNKFGMEMVELPAKERTTMKDKRGILVLRHHITILTLSSCTEDERRLQNNILLHPHNNSTNEIPHTRDHATIYYWERGK